MPIDTILTSASKKEPPQLIYYNQDFVDLYEKSWLWIKNQFLKVTDDAVFAKPLLVPQNRTVITLEESLFASFFLVYSNNIFPAQNNLDFFYQHQEENGAIRSRYDLLTGKPILTADNPHGLGPVLLPLVEFNLYHKVGLKKRLRDVFTNLKNYLGWIDSLCKQPNGLYAAPVVAGGMTNGPREGAYYPIDFNAQMAISFLYLSAIGDILNDKETSFIYKKYYYSLKNRINNLMWCDRTGFYYDLDQEERIIPIKTLAGFWPLLAELPSEARSEILIAKLQDEKLFYSPNPFTTVSMDEPSFSKQGDGYFGSVFPHLTYMVIKGLEKYSRYELAREATIKHLYYILDTLHPDHRQRGHLWNAYLPTREGPPRWEDGRSELLPQYLNYACVSTIALMIENVVGLLISLPKKTVDWIVPTIEIMGIENFTLKRNFISINVAKSNRGWEIRLESEKLYYFTVNIVGIKKKTLPIPSGKCSLLVDKI